MTKFIDLLQFSKSNLDQYLINPHIPNSCISCKDIFVCALECAYESEIIIQSALSKRETKEFGHSDVSSTKCSEADLVTETDVAVEELIKSKIFEKFPDHLFIGEESNIINHDRKGKYLWIIDPIDGTTNFVHNFPIFAISIGFAYEDENIFGLVYNPSTKELWFAWKDCGAYMKQSDGSIIQIKASACEKLGSAIISTGFCIPLLRRITNANNERNELFELVQHNIKELMLRCRDIRRIGSAACDLCYVAMGRTDCFFELGIKEWDIAAGLVILHEANGVSSTVGGIQPYSTQGRNLIVTSTEALRLELVSILVDKDINRIIDAIEK